MTTTHTPLTLAEDAIALERAVGTLDDAARAVLTPYLGGLRRPMRGDCALDIVIEGRPVAERVEFQRAAKAGGYRRPFLRH